jgi:hypothetical protein
MRIDTCRSHARTPVLGALTLAIVTSSGAFAQNHPSHANPPGQQTIAQKNEAGALIALVRESVGPLRDIGAAEAEGYSLLFGCVTGPDSGAMGLHYANRTLVGDGELDPARPEIVTYEPVPNGGLRIVGADYLVLADAWHAKHGAAPPELMGQRLHLFEAPNRFGLPPFYTVHVWTWKDNPNGAFVDSHASGSCNAFSGQPL